MSKPSEMLVERLVQAIESGIKTGEWVRPWKSGHAQNVVSGHVYTGNNALYLAVYRAFANTEHTPYYGTVAQWNQLGARVKQGSKGFSLIKNPQKVEKKDEAGEVTGTYTFWPQFVVFNSTQVEGWEPPSEKPVESDSLVRDKFTTLIAKHDITINTGVSAYYTPTCDEITMPAKASFAVEDDYWATLAHEVIHWTGHPTRLNRIDIGKHRGEAYAFEELVAELGSVFMATSFGITPKSDHNILAYLSGWHKRIREDKTTIRTAVALASDAVKFLN
jgi:antirestriction protein ArdC